MNGKVVSGHDLEISELQIEEAKRHIIACYEILHGVNLYGILPSSHNTPEFKAAYKKALDWAKNKRADLVAPLNFVCS